MILTVHTPIFVAILCHRSMTYFIANIMPNCIQSSISISRLSSTLLNHTPIYPIISWFKTALYQPLIALSIQVIMLFNSAILNSIEPFWRILRHRKCTFTCLPNQMPLNQKPYLRLMAQNVQNGKAIQTFGFINTGSKFSFISAILVSGK